MTMDAPKPWTVTDPTGEVVISESSLSQTGLRLVDRLITEMVRDEKPSTARFQRIQTLCSIGAHLNQIYAVAIEEAQPLEEELGGLGYVGVGGYGGNLPMPVPLPRARRVGQFVGGDQAELIRMLLAAVERLNPAQRDAATTVAAAVAADITADHDAAVAEGALDRAHDALAGVNGALTTARAAVRDAEAAVARVENPLG